MSILLALVLMVGIKRLVHVFRRKRFNTLLPASINYVRKDISPQGPFLYLELELKNRSGNSLQLSEIQQRNIEGPFKLFLIQDAKGNTKKSLYEIREFFPKKLEVKSGESLFRYYRLNLQPEWINRKLYFQYQVITKNGIASQSKAKWVIPAEVEQVPFIPKK